MHLDGLAQLENFVIEPITQATGNPMFRGWCRLTVPLHVALTLLRTTTCQSLRGTSSITTGALTLDQHHLASGLNDYASMLVQLIALPAVGILTMYSPEAGLQFSQTITHKHDCERNKDNMSMMVPPASTRYQRVVETFFKGVAGCPNAIVFSATTGAQNLLLGEFRKAAFSIPYAIGAPIWSLVSAFVGGIYDHNYNFVHLMNQCTPKEKLL